MTINIKQKETYISTAVLKYPLQEKHQYSSSTLSSSSSPMGLKQNGECGYSTAVLKYPLEEKNLFRIEYKINEIEDSEGCQLNFGCVIHSLCPFPKNEELGTIEGSACFWSWSSDARVFFGGPYGSSFCSDPLGASFSLPSLSAEGSVVAAELDLRDGKKTLAFSVDGNPVPFYVTNLPPTPLYFAVELACRFSVSFVSFMKGSRGSTIPLLGESGRWR